MPSRGSKAHQIGVAAVAKALEPYFDEVFTERKLRDLVQAKDHSESGAYKGKQFDVIAIRDDEVVNVEVITHDFVHRNISILTQHFPDKKIRVVFVSIAPYLNAKLPVLDENYSQHLSDLAKQCGFINTRELIRTAVNAYTNNPIALTTEKTFRLTHPQFVQALAALEHIQNLTAQEVPN